MARTRPVDRFPQLISAAAETFIAQGYQRTQMQDIADRLSVAKGTVYGYVESKAALLGAALRYADGIEPPPPEDTLPLPTPAEGELATMVTDRLQGEAAQLRLTKALFETNPDDLNKIIQDLYHRLAKHRVSIKLIDRCAPELPDLGQVWFGLGRTGQVAGLTEYLHRHSATGALHLPGPASIVARTILETCVLWAVHLHWDPTGIDSTRPDGDTIAATLAGLLTTGLHPPQET